MVENVTDPFELLYNVDFTASPEFKNDMIDMYPTTFRIMEITQVTKDINIELYTYYEFGN